GAAVAADGDQAAAHGTAPLVAGPAVHEDDAAAHPHGAAAVRRAGQVAGVAADVDAAAAHLRPDPVARVAVDDDLAAAHLRPEVHAGVAAHGDPPAGHAGPDPLHPAAVALDRDLLVGRVPGDAEELAQRRRGVAVLYRQGGDLRRRLPGQVVRRDALGLDGDGRGVFVL